MMHWTTVRGNPPAEGELDRLLLLDAWRESDLYTGRERAALAWAEALIRIAERHAEHPNIPGLANAAAPDDAARTIESADNT